MTNEIPEGMLPFDLEKALNGWPVVYISDKIFEAKFLFHDEITDDSQCLLFVIKNFYGKGWEEGFADLKGKTNGAGSFYLKKKTRTYWVNIHKDPDGIIFYDTFVNEITAKEYAKLSTKYIKTISFDLDEPEEKPKTMKRWVAIHKNEILTTFAWSHETKRKLEQHLLERGNKLEDYWLGKIECDPQPPEAE